MATRKSNGRSLVIVESPAKAKTINKYLGKDYVVKASMGHVRDLPERDFGIDVTDEFKPSYQIVKGRTRVVNELKKLASNAPLVYLATDRDREGEAIAWHLVEALNLPTDRTRRVIFNEITRSAITEAFSHPHTIDLDRVNAQQARRILDRIVGYELSPLLWKKIAKGLSAGRVQSVAVRLIVEREREIRAFKPLESWKISGIVCANPMETAARRADWLEYTQAEHTQKEQQQWLAEHDCFRTELSEVAGKPFKPDNVDDARAVAEALGYRVAEFKRRPWREYQHLDLHQSELVGEMDSSQVPPLTVAELNTRRTTTKPSAPFTTAALQQVASNVLRFSASRTMRTAQALYEGIDLNGEGAVGLITYMRTDSTNLAAEAIQAVREFIRRDCGEQYVPDKPNYYGKRQSRAQEAHEAVRPTNPDHTPASLKRALTTDQLKLYELIWKRFVACQMPAAQWDSTSVSLTCDTTVGQARFTGAGRRLVFDGFMRIAGVASADQILPSVDEGQIVGCIDLRPRQQFTSPPPRYTEASLVKTMETEGIGRPSTYAAIIETIQSRGYVEQEDRKFFPSALGELVTDKLVAHFPRIMDVKFTSFMEDELDKIEEAHLDWVRVLHEFYDPFRILLNQAGDGMEAVRSQPSDHACPTCAAPMVYRWSKVGRFLACTKYPECKATLNVDRDGQPIIPTESEHKCELCDRPMILRQSKTGSFLGCSGYPECRNTVPCDEHGQPLRLVTEQELQRLCEACDVGTMIVKRKGRRAFLGCNRYPECKNIVPLPADVRLEKKPAPPPENAGVTCERCKRPMVIRSGKRGKFIACSGFPKCRNTKPIEKLDELKAAAEKNVAAAPSASATPREKPTSTTSKGTGKAHEKYGEPHPGFAWTRTGRPVVEVMPEPGTLLCPECGSTMDLKRGRFGPFFSCTNFPKCRCNANLRGEAKKQAEESLPAPARPKPIPTDIQCDECGSTMLIRQGRRGKFLGCGNYPKCKSTHEIPPGFDVSAAEASAKGKSSSKAVANTTSN
ncbi:MAG: type I DNA topoisomerase [Planctomycetota bacterium]